MGNGELAYSQLTILYFPVNQSLFTRPFSAADFPEDCDQLLQFVRRV